MPIEVVCACGKQMTVPNELAGRRGKCRACGAVVSIPDPAPVFDPLAVLVVDDEDRMTAAVADTAGDAVSTNDGSANVPPTMPISSNGPISPTVPPPLPSNASPVGPAAGVERVLLKEQFVQVTTCRLMIGPSRLYLISHIASIEFSKKPPDRTGLIGMVVIGVLLLVAALAVGSGIGAAVLAGAGLVLLVVAAVVGSQLKSEPFVRFGLSSGERFQVMDPDEGFVRRVMAAAAEAVTCRE